MPTLMKEIHEKAAQLEALSNALVLTVVRIFPSSTATAFVVVLPMSMPIIMA